MNVVLWVLQGVLAPKFASIANTHGVRAHQTKMQRGTQRFGAATQPVHRLIALAPLVGELAAFLAYGRSVLAPL